MPLENILIDQEFCPKPTIPQKAIQRPLVVTYETNEILLSRKLVEDRLNSFTDSMIRLSALPTSSSCNLQLRLIDASFPWLSRRYFMSWVVF